MKRNATAVWNGSGKEGKGHLTTQSKTLDQTQYSYLSRFENGNGTNPEELMAAALAGCFAMKLTFVLGAAGFTAEQITTDCAINNEAGTITKGELVVKAKVPGIDAQKFSECVEETRANCTVRKSYNFDITVDASLV